MTKTVVIIAVVGIAVIAAVALFPRIANAYARDQAASQCEALEAERARLVRQGAEVADIAVLDAQIRQCAVSAAKYGASLDLSDTTLAGCTNIADRIQTEWSSFKATDTSDPVSRSNKLNTIFRLVSEMNNCFRTAIDDAITAPSLQRVLDTLAREIQRSTERKVCWDNRSSGCNRGLSLAEPHEDEQAVREVNQALDPLRATYAYGIAKMSAIAPRSTAVNFNSNVLRRIGFRS